MNLSCIMYFIISSINIQQNFVLQLIKELYGGGICEIELAQVFAYGQRGILLLI